ncbi:MAG: hypothetical protein E6215_07965, partial [Anaerococcus prevotii]|nr:hypothetical protein [Anaerococcus prevotii]
SLTFTVTRPIRNDGIGRMADPLNLLSLMELSIRKICHPEERSDVRISSRYFGFNLTERYRL